MADAVSLPESPVTVGGTTYEPVVLVGDFLFTGLGPALTRPTNEGTDFIVWGKSAPPASFSSKLTDPPEPLPNPAPGGGNSTTYPNGDPPDLLPKGWGMSTIAELRSVFGELAPPGQVLDDFALYVTINEAGNSGAQSIAIEKLEISIIDHRAADDSLLGPDGLPTAPGYLLAHYTLDSPTPTPPDPFIDVPPWADVPPHRITLLNDTQSGQSEAGYQFRVNNGMNLSAYAPEELVRFNIELTALTNGQEIIWGETGVFRPGNFDFGDAPHDNVDYHYKTLQEDGGPVHAIGAHERLGYGWDGEENGNPTLGASGDDATETNDEDGVWYEAGWAHVTLTVDEAGLPAFGGSRYGAESYKQLYLDGWLDADGDGVFEDTPEEHIVDSHAEDPTTWGGTSKTIDVPLPGFVPRGQGDYFRWRLSYGAMVNGPGGYAPYGEVEDYMVTPEPATVSLFAVTLVLLARRRRRPK